MEELLKQIYAFFKLDPSTYPVLVTVPPKTSPANKAKLAKLFFDVRLCYISLRWRFLGLLAVTVLLRPQ